MGTMARKNRTPAIAYLRTSSATNVGADKDSDKRQRVAIASFARRAGYELVDEYYDKAARGADALEAGPGFCAMLERIAGNGVHTIIVEMAKSLRPRSHRAGNRASHAAAEGYLGA